jgi:RNA polymerase sigma-70 factor (ECF subfamily)
LETTKASVAPLYLVYSVLRQGPAIDLRSRQDIFQAMGSFKSDDVLTRASSGDEQAAAELYDRYVDRLIHLARKRLSPQLARRTDPEDITQSAFRSFFRHVRNRDYSPQDGSELWKLLAAITVGKALHAARRHTAEKRSVFAEQSSTGDDTLHRMPSEAMAREPTPEEAAILVEETELAMQRLSTLQRHALELRLQGYPVEETAARAGCSERTVRRVLKLVETRLHDRLSKESQRQ